MDDNTFQILVLICLACLTVRSILHDRLGRDG